MAANEFQKLQLRGMIVSRILLAVFVVGVVIAKLMMNHMSPAVSAVEPFFVDYMVGTADLIEDPIYPSPDARTGIALVALVPEGQTDKHQYHASVVRSDGFKKGDSVKIESFKIYQPLGLRRIATAYPIDK
jgi:hypothetical protein